MSARYILYLHIAFLWADSYSIKEVTYSINKYNLKVYEHIIILVSAMGGCNTKAASLEKNWDEAIVAIASKYGVSDVSVMLKKDACFNEQVVEAAAHAYAGNRFFDGEPVHKWLYGPELVNRENCLKERCKLSRTLLRFVIGLYGTYPAMGRVLTILDQDQKQFNYVESTNLFLVPKKKNVSSVSPADEGSPHRVPAGVGVVRLYSTGYEYEWGERTLWPHWLIASMGTDADLPECFTDVNKRKEYDDFDGRGTAVSKLVEREQHRLFNNVPHIYLALIAISPGAQGKGYAGRILKTITEVADALHLPCYLEAAGGHLHHIFSRYGFRVSSSHTVEYSGTCIGDDQQQCSVLADFACMIRAPESLKEMPTIPNMSG